MIKHIFNKVHCGFIKDGYAKTYAFLYNYTGDIAKPNIMFFKFRPNHPIGFQFSFYYPAPDFIYEFSPVHYYYLDKPCSLCKSNDMFEMTNYSFICDYCGKETKE